MDSETCVRCRGEVSIDSDDFSLGEATANGEYICSGCLTGVEQQAVDEAQMRMADTTPLGDATDPRADPL